jgi:hypothetical protein
MALEYSFLHPPVEVIESNPLMAQETAPTEFTLARLVVAW